MALALTLLGSLACSGACAPGRASVVQVAFSHSHTKRWFERGQIARLQPEKGEVLDRPVERAPFPLAVHVLALPRCVLKLWQGGLISGSKCNVRVGMSHATARPITSARRSSSLACGPGTSRAIRRR